MSNKDLFSEFDEIQEPQKTEGNVEDEGWGDEPEEVKEPIVEINSVLEVDEPEERLDSSEVLRNAKIAYSKEIEDKMNEFFRSEDIKFFKWTTRRRNPFYCKILRTSATIGFVKAVSGAQTQFNFYDKKLLNYVKGSKELKGFFDFQ